MHLRSRCRADLVPFCEQVAKRLQHPRQPKGGAKTENEGLADWHLMGPEGSVVYFKIERHTPLS